MLSVFDGFETFSGGMAVTSSSPVSEVSMFFVMFCCSRSVRVLVTLNKLRIAMSPVPQADATIRRNLAGQWPDHGNGCSRQRALSNRRGRARLRRLGYHLDVNTSDRDFRSARNLAFDRAGVNRSWFFLVRGRSGRGLEALRNSVAGLRFVFGFRPLI